MLELDSLLSIEPILVPVFTLEIELLIPLLLRASTLLFGALREVFRGCGHVLGMPETGSVCRSRWLGMKSSERIFIPNSFGMFVRKIRVRR